MTRTSTRRQRADAQRSVAAIVSAAASCLAVDPEASITDIATAAGVGRVTVYGHFASRTELIDATMRHTLAEADAILGSVDLDGAADVALGRLIASTWRLTARFRGLLVAAERTLPAEQILAAHAEPARRIQSLVDRGRTQGVFRTDLPGHWLITMLHAVIHAAATEVSAGRLAEDDAAETITTTVLGVFRPAGRT